MGILSVQIQPNLLAPFPEEAVEELSALSSLCDIEQVEILSGEDDGPYININFHAQDPVGVWKALRPELFRLGLQRGCIVACTVSNDWRDYLLLYHFDHSQPVD